MSSIKTTSVRGAAAAAALRRSGGVGGVKPTSGAAATDRAEPVPALEPFEPAPLEVAMSAFLRPRGGMAAALRDPHFGAVLQDAAASMAEIDGEDPAVVYALTVIETHLSARRSLAHKTNALIKT